MISKRLNLSVQYVCNKTGLPLRPQIRTWARAALDVEGAQGGQITIRFVDAEEGQSLNRDYRGKDYATNVLSFALNEGEALHHAVSGSLTGDIVFCPQVVAQEAAAQGKTLMQHYAHLTVHGVLHLMGYDHIDEAEAEAMEALEIRILNQLGYADPYLEDPS